MSVDPTIVNGQRMALTAAEVAILENLVLRGHDLVCIINSLMRNVAIKLRNYGITGT